MTGRTKCLLFALMLSTVASVSDYAQAREFRLGIVSDKPVEQKISGHAPIAKYVAERLKPFGVTGGKVVVANDIDEMLQKIRKKEVDIVLESAFSTLRMSEKTGMKPKLLTWKHGIRDYRTVFFLRKDSPITKLSELKGKVIALQDPGSTSGFLIPTAELRQIGLKVAPSNAKAPRSAVRYVLVGHEKNQAFWVIQKKAAAAAFASDDWNELTELEKRDLKVIHKTKPVLRYLVSFHPDLPPDLSRAISTILVQMDRDPEGREIMGKASHIKKIEPLSVKDYRSLDYVRQLMKGQ